MLTRLVFSTLALVLPAMILSGCEWPRPEEKPHTMLGVAEAAMASGAPDLALRVATLQLETQPNNPQALIAKADALIALGDITQARDTYRQALAVDSRSIAAQMGLGRTLVRADPKAAEAVFQGVLRQQPSNEAAWNDLGIARDLQGRHDDAQHAYREALAIAPSDAEVQSNMAMSSALAGGSQPVVAQPTEPSPPAPAAPPPTPVPPAESIPPARHAESIPLARQAESVPPARPAESTPPARQAESIPPARQAESTSPARQAETTPPIQQRDPEASPPAASVRTDSPPSAGPTYFVQVSALDSMLGARSEWRQLTMRWPELFEGRSPVIQQAEVHERMFWRLRIGGFATGTEARTYCAQLRAAGVDCWATVVGLR